MSEDKLPVRTPDEFFRPKEPPIVLKKIEGVKSSDELEQELIDSLHFNFFDKLWYGVAKVLGVVGEGVRTAEKVINAIEDVKQLLLYAGAALVLLIVLVLVLK